MSHYRISINHRALEDISKGHKTIEGRIKKGIFNHISKNDLINFYNRDRNLKVKVVNIIEYSNIQQYLHEEDLSKIVPNKSYREILEIYNNFYPPLKRSGYKFLAIKISLL